MSSDYAYKGAASLVRLHEYYMRDFVDAWRAAKAARVALPTTDDPDYVSLETVLAHVLRSARGYMVWVCEQLDLPDPDIRSAPETDEAEAEADAYLGHVLERWRTPLLEVPRRQFGDRGYRSAWGVEYCIDAMLEHAVMHPIRHAAQLRTLLSSK